MCHSRKTHSIRSESSGEVAHTVVLLFKVLGASQGFFSNVCSFSKSSVPVKVFSHFFVKIVLLFTLQGASEVFGAPSLQIPPNLYLRARGGRGGGGDSNGHQDARPEPTTRRPSQDDGT